MAEEPTGFPKPGDIFEDRYRIDKLIGSGGFAKVYLAEQMDLGREVALKIMLPEEVLADVLGGDESSNQGHKLAERFMQEARVVAKLRDPHTVTMYDHGRSEAGLLYMVFEYVDGVPLSRLVKAQGPLEPRRVAKIVRQTLESLQEAHSMGMLHRDVKPGNIMVYEHVGRADQVKVLDFGIAKVVGQKVNQDLRGDLTTNGALLGTPRYMSPEQIRGQELNAASDIYSLGLVAYELLTGQKAIDSNSSVIVIGAQLDPRSFAVPNLPHIPPNLRMIVNRMLSKERGNRYPDVAAVLDDLTRLDTGAFPAAELPPRQSGAYPVADVPDISDSIEPIDVAAAEQQHREEVPDFGKSRRGVMIGIGALCIVIGVFVAITLTQSSEPGDETADPSITEKSSPDERGADDSVLAAIDDAKSAVETELDRGDDGDGEAVEEIVISTTPSSLPVFVNNEPRGKSPVIVKAAELSYPVEVRASMGDGRERKRVIDNAVRRVNLDLSMFATASKDDELTPDPKPTKKRPPKKRPPKKRPPKKDDKPSKDDESDDEPSSTTNPMNLPALDSY